MICEDECNDCYICLDSPEYEGEGNNWKCFYCGSWESCEHDEEEE